MNNEEIDQLNNLLLLEMTKQLRFTIIERLEEEMRNRSIETFRSATQTTTLIIEPLSLYDLLQRLPETSDEPIEEFGEIISYLCEMLENFKFETKLRSETTIQSADDMQKFIMQLTSEICSSEFNCELIISFEELEEISLRTFEPPRGILDESKAAPTQSDIEALKEMFEHIKSHHGKAAVLGRFLRECGVQGEDFVESGGVYDIDFTALPNQMFWRLAEICKRYAPKVKAIE